MTFEIWLKDDDSEVHVATQAAEPPRLVDIVDNRRSIKDGVVYTRKTRYKLVSKDGNRYIYTQEL